MPHLHAGTGRVGSVFLSFFSWGVGRKPLVLNVLAQESKACYQGTGKSRYSDNGHTGVLMRLLVENPNCELRVNLWLSWLRDHTSVGGETRTMENQYNLFVTKVSHSVWRFSFPLWKLARAHAKFLGVAEVSEAAWFGYTYVLKTKASIILKPWFKSCNVCMLNSNDLLRVSIPDVAKTLWGANVTGTGPCDNAKKISWNCRTAEKILCWSNVLVTASASPLASVFLGRTWHMSVIIALGRLRREKPKSWPSWATGWVLS